AFNVPAGVSNLCIATGLAVTARPYFLPDSGDNPTAGGAGDVAYMLERLLAHPDIAAGRATAILASVVDPAAVARCIAGGEGAAVELAVGGAFGSQQRKVTLRGKVGRILGDDPVGGDIAVVTSGGVRAILTTRRKPYHFVRDLQAVGLDPARHDLTVVKIGYLVPDLFAAAKGWVLALTPGGVDQDIVRLGHRHLERPIHPFDPNIATPNIKPLLID